MDKANLTYKERVRLYGKEVLHNPCDKFMKLALSEAKTALNFGEAPIGAVIVRRGEVIAAAHNTRETEKNALNHAEIIAINSACERLGGWRLWECEMYVTLEPCIMCIGAIMQARIPNLYFGAYDEKGGCTTSRLDINSLGLNHTLKYSGGIMETECAELMTEFFKKLRQTE